MLHTSELYLIPDKRNFELRMFWIEILISAGSCSILKTNYNVTKIVKILWTQGLIVTYYKFQYFTLYEYAMFFVHYNKFLCVYNLSIVASFL